MAKIPNDEFERIEADTRHGEMMLTLGSAIEAISTRRVEIVREDLTPLLEKNFAAIELMAANDNAPDLQPLIDQINLGWREIAVLLARPKAFRVERGTSGLIERIIVEE